MSDDEKKVAELTVSELKVIVASHSKGMGFFGFMILLFIWLMVIGN